MTRFGILSENVIKRNTNTIDGVCGVQNIASMWGKHCQGFLNVSKYTSCRELIINICNNISPSDDTIVTVDEVTEATHSSKSGKSPDHHGINSEDLKCGSNHIPIMLSFLFTSILVHGYIPKNFTLSSLVPLIKNESGDLTSKDSCRRIAINSVLSKILK